MGKESFEFSGAEDIERKILHTEETLTEFKARRVATREALEARKKTLDEGDAKLKGKALSDGERKIRSEVLAEGLADIRKGEEMLKILDSEIIALERTIEILKSEETGAPNPWNDPSYRNGDNKGAQAN